jgi:ribonuclease PH
VIDMTQLGERTIWLDCDVLQADGGTRTASITGAYVTLHMALQHLVQQGALASVPLTDCVAAVSLGIFQGVPYLDLNYAEDSTSEADLNIVMTGSGALVEIQGTAERHPFTEDGLLQTLTLARHGIEQLIVAQRTALSLP